MRLPVRDDQGPVPALWYALLFVVVLLVAATGWLGFIAYPKLGLPAAQGATLLGLAAFAGVAALFSPCSFPLLATILAREIGGDQRRSRTYVALRFALALSVGAAAFLLLVGLAVAAGSGQVLRGVTFGSVPARVLRFALAAFLLALALVQLGVVRVEAFHRMDALVRPLQRRQAELRRSAPLIGYLLYGFGYVLAGFG